MVPQSSVDTNSIKIQIATISDYLQDSGYCGYAAVDLCCFKRKHEERQEMVKVLVIDIHPYYGHAQTFIDWIKFAIDGNYDSNTNTCQANVKLLSDTMKQRASFVASIDRIKWNDTVDRYAIGVINLKHKEMDLQKWKKLEKIIQHCGVNSDFLFVCM